MTDQDVRDLWDAIDKQRAQQTVDSARLVRIETLLQERCAYCVETQRDHESRIKSLEASRDKEKGGRVALMTAMVVAGTISGIVVKFWPFGR